MNPVLKWFEEIFALLPLPLLEVWGRFGYLIGFALMLSAYGGFTFRPGGRWAIGRERQSWDARALLSVAITFVSILITGYLGSLIVLVPEAQTFESLKDLSVFLCISLFGYPALIAVPFAYGFSDLMEGVPPDFLLDWLVGYFINPSCFWVAYQFIGKDPDFRKLKTWGWYSLFVLIFMSIEPQLWGYICSDKFTSEISYRNILPALFFTTLVTWIIAPFVMLGVFPLAKRYSLFWAEIPGHCKEKIIGETDCVWESGKGSVTPSGGFNDQGLPIRMFLVTPFIVLVLIMVGTTSYLTLRSSEETANKLAARLHQEISENINLQLDDFLSSSKGSSEFERLRGVGELLKRTNIAAAGRAFIIDRRGKLISSSNQSRYSSPRSNAGESAEDRVIQNAVRRLTETFGNLDGIDVSTQSSFHIITAKPLFRENWLMQATRYHDNSKSLDWIVITAMPEAYYLEGVRTGNSQSAMVFAVALVLSLLIAAFLSNTVTAPITRISQATQAIAEGDLTQRVPMSRLAELGVLSSSFNHMAEQLQEFFHRTKSSEERSLDLVATTPGIVWEADAITFNFTFVSQQAERLLGYSVEDWKEPGFWADHIHHEDRERAVNYCVECTARLEPHEFEYRFIAKDGRTVWLRDLVRVIAGDAKPKWLRGVMVDITERKIVEEKLLERNQFIESILDITPDILYIYDIVEMKNVYSNNGIQVVSGYSVEEIREMGSKILPILVHPEDYQVYVDHIIPKYATAGDKDLIEHHYRIRHKDGNWRWLTSRELIYRRNTDGSPKEIFGISYDITENKQAEATILDLNATLEKRIEIRTDELRKSNESLVEAVQNLEKTMHELKEAQGQLLLSEKLATLGQLAAGMTHELNTPLGAIVSSNRAILDIIQDEIRSIPNFLSNLNEEDLKRFKIILDVALREASRSEEFPNRTLRKEVFRALRESGIEDYESIANSVIETGLYRVEKDLPWLLQSENASKILQVVASLSTIVRLSNVISIATGKASHVVEALKNYLNPGGEVQEEEVSFVDVRAEIETILTLYHSKIKYGVEIVRNYDTNEKCLGNADKLNQVWINLLNNGLHSMDYKGKMEIIIEKQEPWIITSFIDSGSGIPKEIQGKIFEPFFTTKKHGEGVGLGLDICKKIIEKMGGRIEFESVPGRTKFSVWLKSANPSKEALE
ncbi:PAS domain S-box protein [Leptospira inadai serovar Lyme str. 10]|uniref:histidine kinase n=2 Tax=Leptospira inadai serovar Lyme TaxID=293084 RepID=V6HC78_9LEPT|nr:PAS domain-containing protein [Leptospira inadai]EQA37416.1 PAS domain S-box protein [Leptospira inadai serovar Lyme str. 10]PNV73325.1 PAS domain-containing sensor histidine kinase [Leptospira inadai serovar Lyme]